MKSLDEQLRSKCKFFNGLLNEQCDAGIPYKQFLYENYDKFPCLAREDGTFTGACAHFELKTEEEIAQEKTEIAAAFNRYTQALNDHVCPYCGQSTLPERQVDCCVYGACGHRLYQGKLRNSEEDK